MNYSIKSVKSKEELVKTYEFFKRIFKDHQVMENPEYTFEKWEERMKTHGELMIYASLDEKVIGIVFGRTRDDINMTIGPVAVHEDYRKTGLARKLMEECEKRALNHGIKTINLGAVESAEEFYTKVGYRGSLLIQSQEHTIDDLLSLDSGYEVRFTKVYDGKVSQVCLDMIRADRDLQRKYENKFKGCYTLMMYTKEI